MAARLMLADGLEMLERGSCGLSQDEDSKYDEDRVYSYLPKADTISSALQLRVFLVLDVEEEDSYDSSNFAASTDMPMATVVGMEGQHYTASITCSIYNSK